MCGVSFSSVGPGASAKKSRPTPIASRGRTATKSVMTPMPPSHWVSDRQNSSPRLKTLKSVKMVAPVVVNPDIDSNSASIGDSPTQT